MKIVYAKKFVKKFSKLDSKLQKKVYGAIVNIPKGDIKRLSGKRTPPIYRLRVSTYRILFNLEDDLLKILLIDSRGDVYKNIDN
ncbi:MAG: type II toxin-antitoxin system RelE/ParE family toxin [Proteobacteria bacterium]|nr:type II toxin-antitoxin system RelE/ParE family toxin [Pseudomonadota bacterium]MCH9749710.1 type II toxin-antitoxin system RelE/ParE family toxin [Pseudomonadota bacterium]